jgi:hypothetical protein
MEKKPNLAKAELCVNIGTIMSTIFFNFGHCVNAIESKSEFVASLV